ncbi:MAG: porin family protein [Nitrospiraceae bacterium]
MHNRVCHGYMDDRVRRLRRFRERRGACNWGVALNIGILVVLALAPDSTSAQTKDFVYIAAALVGSFPEDKDAVFQGLSRGGTQLRPGVGLGIKAAVFPAFVKRMVGLELEYVGHSGRIQFPLSGANAGRSGSSALTVFTSMANLLVQYPDAVVQPYAGVGVGWATGILTDTDIPDRPDRSFEGAWALSYQFIAGARTRLSARTFLFTEYKYLAANFHWTQLAVDFRSHYVLFGVGLSF